MPLFLMSAWLLAAIGLLIAAGLCFLITEQARNGADEVLRAKDRQWALWRAARSVLFVIIFLPLIGLACNFLTLLVFDDPPIVPVIGFSGVLALLLAVLWIRKIIVASHRRIQSLEGDELLVGA